MNTVQPLERIADFQVDEEIALSKKSHLLPVPSVESTGACEAWSLDVVARREIAKLYHSIDAVRTHPGSQVIQFIGSATGEGTSSVSAGIARFLASSVGKKVLLLRESASETSPAETTGLVLQEALENGGSVPEVFGKQPQGNLTVASLVRSEADLPRFLDSQTSSELIGELKEIFPWIIIDSSPLSHSSAALLFSRHSDGIVMVVEADRTRKPALSETRDQLVRSGGKVLGVVFNKQRTYIPKWLAKFVRTNFS